MKQLTDSERLEVAIRLLRAEGLFGEYEADCSELKYNCERNGFYNVPVECEDLTCRECLIKDMERREIDCPYLD